MDIQNIHWPIIQQVTSALNALSCHDANFVVPGITGDRNNNSDSKVGMMATLSF